MKQSETQLSPADCALLYEGVAFLRLQGLDVPERFCEQSEQFVAHVRAWNRRTQLISRADEGQIVDRHILECLAPAAIYPIHQAQHVIDLGSGAGLPGLILAMLLPRVNFSLVESKRRRVLFLKKVSADLQLRNVHICGIRAEDFATEQPGAEIVIARAVAQLAQLWSLSKPLLRRTGTLLAMKGGDCREEIELLRRAHPQVDVQLLAYPPELVAKNRGRLLIAVREKKLETDRVQKSV